MRTGKQNKDLWNNDEDENKGSSTTIIITLIIVVLATFALVLLEKAVQFIFPIAAIAYVIGFLLNGFKK